MRRVRHVVALILFMVARAHGSGPSGWHSISNEPQAWPVTNTPLPYLTTNVLYGQTENLFQPQYGVYCQKTQATWIAWFWLGTNWYQVIGDDTQLVQSGANVFTNFTTFYVYKTGRPTNATFGAEVTNHIGVTSGQHPTNRINICVSDSLNLGACLPNVNADGSSVFTNRTWARDVMLSDASDEPFRWTWLRGDDDVRYHPETNLEFIDDTNIVTRGTNTTTNIVYEVQTNVVSVGETNAYWFARSIPDAVYLVHGVDGGWRYPLWWPCVLLPAGTQTNWYGTSSLMTGSGGFRNLIYGDQSHWQYPYQQTNAVLDLGETRLYDLFFAVSERIQVGMHILDDSMWDWRIQGGSPAPPWTNSIGSIFSYQLTRLHGDHDHASIQALKNAMANGPGAGWAIKELSTNGSFETFCQTPTNYWTWQPLAGTNVDGYWTTNGVLPQYRDIPTWNTSSLWNGDTAHNGSFRAYLDAMYHLPHGWLTTTSNQTVVVAGWKAGQINKLSVTNLDVDVVRSNLYGDYFSYTPRTYFTKGYGGLGHTVTGRWDLINIWGSSTPLAQVFAGFDYGDEAGNTSAFMVPTNQIGKSNSIFYLGPGLDTVVTNPLRLPVNTWGKYPDRQNQDFIFVEVKDFGGLCLDTNQPDMIMTNPCAISMRVVHWQAVIDVSGLNPRTNSEVLLSCTLTNPENVTNVACVLTNYSVASGSREIDYDADGLYRVLNGWVWQIFDVTPYTGEFDLEGRWGTSQYTSSTNLGRIQRGFHDIVVCGGDLTNGIWCPELTNFSGVLMPHSEYCTNIGSGLNSWPWGFYWTDSVDVVSGLLVYPEVCTNFASTRDLYLQSGFGFSSFFSSWSPPVPMGYDIVHSIGYWNLISTEPESTESDVVNYDFLVDGCPSFANEPSNALSYAISGAKVVFKWDAPGGFKYK